MFLGSQIIVHLFLNKFLNPALGPLSSVPAIGCDANQKISLTFKLSNNLFTSFLTEPVSVTIASVLKESFADILKEKITSIQYNLVDDPFGWRYPVN